MSSVVVFGDRPWREEWRQLALRLQAWRSVAETFLARQPGLITEWNQLKLASELLVSEAQHLATRIRGLALPEPYKTHLGQALERMHGLSRVVEGPKGVLHQLLVLEALRITVDEAFLATDEQRRSLVDRAFLHLNRTLSIDDETRDRWLDAFRYETRCEKLGALHLLAHGIYAFKADARTGRTDLILGVPLQIGDDVRAASVLVLTEWKLARSSDAVAGAIREARRQVERYAQVELGGFELRDTRYVVIVSCMPSAMPSIETVGETSYKYVNVVIDPPRPSDWARLSDEDHCKPTESDLHASDD